MSEIKHKKKRIVHIVNRDDKFAAGYIDFMKLNMREFQHSFLTLRAENELDLYDDNDIFYMNSYTALYRDKNIRQLLRDCDKLIVTGVFGAERCLLWMSRHMWEKTYLHFWGGDFYRYRGKKLPFRHVITKQCLKWCVQRCGGVINLVDNDYEQLRTILDISKKHYAAPMPVEPRKRIDYSKYYHAEQDEQTETVRVLLGNSATPENQHQEAFALLQKYQNIQVYCPLSYGDAQYRAAVIDMGHKMLGDRFVPVTEYMEKEDYVKMLSSCAVGIFNNNRQQAMGNIDILFFLGKKIYMRSDTSMWTQYIEDGFRIHDVQALQTEAFAQFREQSTAEKQTNLQAVELLCGTERAREKWLKVLSE